MFWFQFYVVEDGFSLNGLGQETCRDQKPIRLCSYVTMSAPSVNKLGRDRNCTAGTDIAGAIPAVIGAGTRWLSS